jgi:hypothetical protein
LLYKSDLSGLGYGGLAPHVIVLTLGLFDSMKKVYSVQNNNNNNNNNNNITLFKSILNYSNFLMT